MLASVESRRLSAAESLPKTPGCLLVGPRTVNQLIAVAVDFQDIAKRVFHVNHTVGLFAGIVAARFLHALFTARSHNPLCQFLYVRVLHTEVKNPGFPVLEIVFRVGLVLELKKLHSDSIAR